MVQHLKERLLEQLTLVVEEAAEVCQVFLHLLELVVLVQFLFNTQALNKHLEDQFHLFLDVKHNTHLQVQDYLTRLIPQLQQL
jgi:hypothetical protein